MTVSICLPLVTVRVALLAQSHFPCLTLGPAKDILVASNRV